MENEREINSLNAFCDSWLSSWTGNNPDKLIEFYTDDIFYSDPARPNGLQGKANFHAYLKKLLTKYPDWIWTRKTLIPNDEGFCLTWTAKIPSNGKLIAVSGMDRVVLHDFRIVRNEVYFDTKVLFT